MANAKRKSASRKAGGSRIEPIPTRTIRFTVPDTSSPEFRDEARRQSRNAGRSPHEAEEQAFVDAISEMKFE